MRKVFFLLVTVTLFISSLLFSESIHADQPADLILKNASVYTVDEDRSEAEAIAVRNGEIVYVGDNEGVDSFKGANTKVNHLDGKMVLPGFIDSHNHMFAKSEDLFWFSLRPYNTIEEYQQVIKEYYEETSNLKEIRHGGVGWNERLVQEYSEKNGLLPKEIIDEVVSDIPVVIIDNGHHNIWVNSKALEVAKINKDTPNPQGGVIERDPKTGEPTGIVREFTGIARVVDHLPIPYFTVEQNKKGILAFQEDAAKRGTTSVLVPLAGESPHETLLQALQELENENKLTLRYEIALWADETKGTEQIDRFIKLRNEHQGNLYNANSIKIFADGQGLTWDQDNLENVVSTLDKEGFRIFVHAFGPGVSASLDAFENAAKQNGTRDSRHVITHLPNPSDEEVQRFKDLGVIPNPQPGEGWGTERMKSYFDAGIPVTSSSDYPVNDFWHLLGIQNGMAITDWRGNPIPEENASLDQMITSYTINNAHLLFKEDEIGSIEVGKKADLVVLENNLFDIPVEEIGDTKILMTFFEGQEVFRDSSLDDQLIDVSFKDIEKHWAKEYIKESARNGWFHGYPDGNFGPEHELTRIQTTSLFVRISELTETSDVPFTDINSINKETTDELKIAYTNGIVNGYPDQTFKPYAFVTRAQFALMIYRTYNKLNNTIYIPKQSAGFPDISYYDKETRQAIATLVELGIADGDNGLFKPNEITTRAQAAKMLVNFKKVLDKS